MALSRNEEHELTSTTRSTSDCRGTPMNDETMNCGLLMEAARTHQNLVQAALEALKTHAEELDAVVREEIRRTLVDELQTLAAESKGATRALGALRRAANMRLALWSVGMATLCCAIATIGVVAAVHLLLPSSAEIAALRSQREQLVLGIARLEKSGGRIDLRRCGAAERFCVRVDRKAPAFGPGADYLVAAGY